MRFAYKLLLCLFLICSIPVTGLASEYRFYGGPAGGTFFDYAVAISGLAKNMGYQVRTFHSKGAAENIELINHGRADFSISYSHILYQKRSANVKALGFLYSAPAHFVVRADSEIHSIFDLKGKRVGIGNRGSGAAINSEILLKQAGIFDNINIEYIGYRQAAEAFKNNKLDAFWIFAGCPNSSVIKAATESQIRLLNVRSDADKVGLFDAYPHYLSTVIPHYTYMGQKTDVLTYQDHAIWIARSDIPADVVYNLLKTVYSVEGKAYVKTVHPSASQMDSLKGLSGVSIPLHPGAEIFWRQMGVLK